MNQKLLFFDIDGTLITEGTGEIPESTRAAVREARAQGHLLFINTGRTRASLPKDVLEMGFDGLVCGCGTNIYLNDKELLTAKLTNSLCKEVARTVRTYHVPVFYEASDGIYFDYESPQIERWTAAVEGLFKIKGRDIEEILESETQVYDKLLMILEPAEKNEKLKEYLSEHFICIDRGNYMYEVIQKDYSKATGIRFLCDYLRKSLEDCYAFGDSENDRTMLEAVPHSIAMGNAEEGIKKTCSYVTSHIEEDGIYNALKHFRLI